MYCSLFANMRGELYENKKFKMLGQTGTSWVEPEKEEMIPLPKGASIVAIPSFIPIGLVNDEISYYDINPENPQEKITAVAALLPQGFTRTLLPACVSPNKNNRLPLFGYSAVGFKNDNIYVAAVKTDEHRKWHPVYYNTDGLPAKISKKLKKFPNNRILRQLARCSLEYSCFTAQNIFYQRWEGGIPTMTSCNANCIGCISESHTSSTSPQNRIDFIPEVEEVVDIGLEHLENAQEAIISFGQGCEGEPSLNAKKLSETIKIIRQNTNKGTINMNTNAGYTEGIKMLSDAGLDSIRVTVFSLNEKHYNIYHQPINYSFYDVEESIKYALDSGLKVSINLLTFPGFTDRDEEIEFLLEFLNRYQIDMIQLRNLNIDANELLQRFTADSDILGIDNFINILKKEMPDVKIGSYSHPVR
ncbi:radical SAM protein [Candidatus Syntrophocurvum alkaliphilum]|nr:radical SAM protein [Candidatus Syntrophocurvum alkaliphilum]